MTAALGGERWRIAGERRRWALAFSVGLNVFLAALLVAHLLRGPAEATPPTPAERIERLAASLPQADGDRLRAAMQAASGGIAAALDEFRAAQDRMRDALRAEPFDPAALRRAMQEVQGRHAALGTAIQEVVATAAAGMTPAGRAGLAAWPRKH
ncbi:MAG: periplasmic heavy metal sensor [Dongiaceae bacterium]